MYSEDLDSFKENFSFYHRQQNQWVWHFRIWHQWFGKLLAVLWLDGPRRKVLSEISTLEKLLLVMPATNAVSERSFSALKRVKTYLRSTTGDSRLNYLMLLHVHKDRTDTLNLVAVANDFVEEKENRKQNFKTISQTSSLFRQSQHKRKIRGKTRGIVDNCSDLTCTKKYALTKGPKWDGGGELMMSTRSAPPQSFSASWIRWYYLKSVRLILGRYNDKEIIK